ncbi:uncharacterized protein Z518_08494 [Rhinocladiella mackenziei CBS 650.93]|uniref:Prion-inhibition and propagation HeLo domain-containing protein n=1 Tax=Rhinocladiella mackenziei CBS 650.93 TaxID=1442369 RepID=A0A0D2GWG6_9EURO|nr:uncharacterized protein Z518_08494 [Rhinocladiella mackenziei CBS 650.93]KIX02553.1 hypothetical protein Z518_08494 [Rhinocladiella mackenziei CBS 650.93]
MAGPELGLAIVATALVELCDRFRKAEIEIAERITRIHAIWLQTKSQLDVVRQLAPILEEEHRNIQEETLKVFANKLDLTNSKLRSFLKKVEGGISSNGEWQVKNSKYALFGKTLDKAIDTRQIWQRTFDPSWYLIMKAARPQIDVELEVLKRGSTCAPISSAQSLRAALNDNSRVTAPIFLPSDGLESIQISQIPYCSSKLGERHGSGRDVILEQIPRPAPGYDRTLKRNIRNLARKLSYTDPITFGLLNCKGVVEDERTHDPQQAAFTMVFRIPREFSEPHSLRSCLLHGNTNHTLSDRFKLACDLAKSIGYVHTFGFVHKTYFRKRYYLSGPQDLASDRFRWWVLEIFVTQKEGHCDLATAYGRKTSTGIHGVKARSRKMITLCNTISIALECAYLN